MARSDGTQGGRVRLPAQGRGRTARSRSAPDDQGRRCRPGRLPGPALRTVWWSAATVAVLHRFGENVPTASLTRIACLASACTGCRPVRGAQACGTQAAKGVTGALLCHARTGRLRTPSFAIKTSYARHADQLWVGGNGALIIDRFCPGHSSEARQMCSGVVGRRFVHARLVCARPSLVRTCRDRLSSVLHPNHWSCCSASSPRVQGALPHLLRCRMPRHKLRKLLPLSQRTCH
jgi:hypothetical protein